MAERDLLLGGQQFFRPAASGPGIDLIRHFRRLEGVKQRFWEEAEAFVSGIAWLLPLKELVMDVYFTSEHRILIVDLNPWGAPTDPLLLNTWDRDWSQPLGITLMPPPFKITGDVNVSF